MMALGRHPLPVVPQNDDRDGRQIHLPPRTPSLRFPDPQPSIEFVRRMADVKRGSSEIYILPVQTQQFTLPQSCRNRKNVERLKSIAFGCLEGVGPLDRGPKTAWFAAALGGASPHRTRSAAPSPSEAPAPEPMENA